MQHLIVHPVLLFTFALVYSLLFGLEIASASSNKLRLEFDKSKNKLTNKALGFFFDNQNHFISVLWLGSVFFLFLYSASAFLFIKDISENRLWLAFVLSIAAILFLFIMIDIVLRLLFNYNPTSSFRLFVLPLFIGYCLISPFFKLYTCLFNKIKKEENWKFGINNIYLRQEGEKEEEKEEDEKNDIENEVRIFQNALDFSNVKLKNCIVPRTEITAIELNASVKELQSVFVESNYSRILVYKGNIDNIVGYVHSSDMFGKPTDIQSLLNPLIIVPETMAANKLLTLFLQQQKGIALVVDEFGGTAGIITLEDVMEEIFGEIEDEHDEGNEYIAKQLSKDEYLLSGRLEIDEVNEQFGLNLPASDEYVTIAGLILFKNEILPSKNDMITINKYRFTVLRVTATRIELVRLKIIDS